MNATYGAGAMMGAALGGAMADYLGWRWEFGVQVPLLVVCLVVSILVIPDDIGLYGKKKQTLREALRRFDFKGSFLMSTSVTFLILGLVSPTNPPSPSPNPANSPRTSAATSSPGRTPSSSPP